MYLWIVDYSKDVFAVSSFEIILRRESFNFHIQKIKFNKEYVSISYFLISYLILATSIPHDDCPGTTLLVVYS